MAHKPSFIECLKCQSKLASRSLNISHNKETQFLSTSPSFSPVSSGLCQVFC